MIAIRDGLTAEVDHDIAPYPGHPDRRKFSYVILVGLDSHGNPIHLRLEASEVDALYSLLPE